MCAVEVFVYTRKWVGCTQTVQPRYIKDCGAHRKMFPGATVPVPQEHPFDFA